MITFIFKMIIPRPLTIPTMYNPTVLCVNKFSIMVAREPVCVQSVMFYSLSYKACQKVHHTTKPD